METLLYNDFFIDIWIKKKQQFGAHFPEDPENVRLPFFNLEDFFVNWQASSIVSKEGRQEMPLRM